MGDLRAISDGIVTIGPPRPGDADRLVAGRDAESRRFLGEGSPEPIPTACVVVDGEVVGWVDFDRDRTWLEPAEVNLGYGIFPTHRGAGYATRAVKLLLHHLALTGAASVATLLIHPENRRSLALAERAGFTRHGDLDGNPYWKRPVPPLRYADGVVAIRRREPSDLDVDLEAKDDEQIRWLWPPGQREAWEAMSPEGRRRHAARTLQHDHDGFGTGPRWTFSVDEVDGAAGIASVHGDLANPDVPAGEANISYACHPGHRGRGHVSRAVRLLLAFLADHARDHHRGR